MTRVLVYGAGIIGQIYGARLAQAGHDVTLLAHGRTLQTLSESSVTLRTAGVVTHTPVRVVDSPLGEPVPDIVLVTVRRDQLEDVIPAVADLPAGRVVFLLNLPGALEVVRERVGAHRTVFAFPGVGGRRQADGTIDYVEVPQQKTTVEGRGLEAPIVDVLKSAGFPVETTSDMAGWLATHAVFVTAMSAAILACGGDSVALADDPAQLAAMVAAVREGFRALRSQRRDRDARAAEAAVHGRPPVRCGALLAQAAPRTARHRGHRAARPRLARDGAADAVRGRPAPRRRRRAAATPRAPARWGGPAARAVLGGTRTRCDRYATAPATTRRSSSDSTAPACSTTLRASVEAASMNVS